MNFSDYYQYSVCLESGVALSEAESSGNLLGEVR